MKLTRTLICLAALLFFQAAAALGGTKNHRIQVAVVDGVPVWESLVFQSGCKDAVLRFLILQEFRRKDFKLPSQLVDESLRQHIERDYQGKEGDFAAKLEQQGATLEEYKEFLSQEIAIDAMHYNHCVKGKNKEAQMRAESAWPAQLRSQADIKIIKQSLQANLDKPFKY